MRTDGPPENLVFHLAELRRRLIACAAALGLASVAAYPFADRIFGLLVAPLKPEPVYFTSPADAFMIKLRIAVSTGVVIASPFLSGQIWLFISPALYPKEKRAILPLALATALFFVVGALFAFFLVLPPTVGFLIGFRTPSLQPLISVDRYVAFAVGFVLAFGVAFNLPVAVAALSFVGLVRHRDLVRWRKVVIVVLFFAAAVLTPSPDVLSQLLLGIPLVLLYEASLIAAWWIERRRK